MMLRVLEVARITARSYDERWGRLGIRGVRVGYDQVFEVIHSPSSSELIVDAVVLRGDSIDPETGTGVTIMRVVRAVTPRDIDGMLRRSAFTGPHMCLDGPDRIYRVAAAMIAR
jgi:hypothetical protein